MKTLVNPTPEQRHAWSVLDRLHSGTGLGTRWRGHPEVALALRLLDRLVGFFSWAEDETTAPGEGMRRHVWDTRADVVPPTQSEITEGCTLADEMITAARWELHPESPAEVAMRAVAEVLDPLLDAEFGRGPAEDDR